MEFEARIGASRATAGRPNELGGNSGYAQFGNNPDYADSAVNGASALINPHTGEAISSPATQAMVAGTALTGLEGGAAFRAGKTIPFVLKTARSLVSGAVAGASVTAILKKMGVNDFLADSAGTIVGLGAGSAENELEKRLGQATADKLAAKLAEENIYREYMNRQGTPIPPDQVLTDTQRNEAVGVAKGLQTKAAKAVNITKAPEPPPPPTAPIQSNTNRPFTPGEYTIRDSDGSLPFSRTVDITHPPTSPLESTTDPRIDSSASGPPIQLPKTGWSLPPGGTVPGTIATPNTAIPEPPGAPEAPPPAPSTPKAPATAPDAQETPNSDASSSDPYAQVKAKAALNTENTTRAKELLWSEHLAGKGVDPNEVRAAANDNQKVDAWRQEINKTYGVSHRMISAENQPIQMNRIADMMEGTWNASPEAATQGVSLEPKGTATPATQLPSPPVPERTVPVKTAKTSKTPKTSTPAQPAPQAPPTPARPLPDEWAEEPARQDVGPFRRGDQVTYLGPSNLGSSNNQAGMYVVNSSKTGYQYLNEADLRKLFGR